MIMIKIQGRSTACLSDQLQRNYTMKSTYKSNLKSVQNYLRLKAITIDLALTTSEDKLFQSLIILTAFEHIFNLL